jgi:Holliday junction resolvase RusA-like endonuclease
MHDREKVIKGGRMTLDIKMIPPTATSQENKVAVVNGKMMHYKSKGAKQTFSVLTAALAPFAPAVPMDGPIRLEVEWRFPKGKSHKNNEWRISKPDTDNLQKALKDVMTRLGYWVDDSRVCHELVAKIWSDDPGIWIKYESLEERYE